MMILIMWHVHSPILVAQMHMAQRWLASQQLLLTTEYAVLVLRMMPLCQVCQDNLSNMLCLITKLEVVRKKGLDTCLVNVLIYLLPYKRAY